MSENKYQLDLAQILKFVPHRYPFLLVDRVLEIHPAGDINNFDTKEFEGTKVKALRAVSGNEAFFQGHFPGFPIMPGVLLIEAMAQTTIFSLYPWMEKDLENLADGFQTVLVGTDKARFRKPVVPGDVVVFETEVLKSRGRLWRFGCQARVDGKKVADAEILANLLVKGEGF